MGLEKLPGIDSKQNAASGEALTSLHVFNDEKVQRLPIRATLRLFIFSIRPRETQPPLILAIFHESMDLMQHLKEDHMEFMVLA